MAPRIRRVLFVDGRVQGALMLRAILYWVCWLITFTFLVLCWRICTQPPQLFEEHFQEVWTQLGPALVASLLLLPVVLMDVLRLSNRFAGPLVRFRRNLRQLANGEAAAPLHFRRGDYWRELAEDLNRVAAQLHDSEPAESRHQSPDEPVAC